MIIVLMELAVLWHADKLMLAFLELSTSGIPQLHTDSECSESTYDLETKRTTGELVDTVTRVNNHLMLVTCSLCIVTLSSDIVFD